MTRVIPPLVFLHSLAGSPAHWEPLIEELRDRPDLASVTAVQGGVKRVRISDLRGITDRSIGTVIQNGAE